MADRCDFYFRQRVTEAELDLAFELLEKADRNLASDVGVFGVISGAVPTPHFPVPDLTIDLTAPARAYDRLGQRIFFGTGQQVDLAVDATGIPTEVSTVGQERWVGVFLRFKRQLSDPRTDGNSQLVHFRRDESFELVVRQAPQGPTGAASKVALVEGELLLCDVLRRAGQTQILAADIDLSRRQAFVFAEGTSVAVSAALWKAISTSVSTAQGAFDAIDALLGEHFAGAANQHRAMDIAYPPHAFLTKGTLEDALDELLDALVAQSATPGAARIGTRALPGIPNALAASSVDAHLAALLGWLNGHLAAPAGAHTASAIAATPHAFVASKSVQAQLQEIVDVLQSSVAGRGAALLGSEALGGAPRAVTTTGLRDQLLAILGQLNAHVGSADHDTRYLRRIYSNAFLIPISTTRVFGTLPQVPDFISVAYNLVDAGGSPVQPQYHQGPYALSLQTTVDKATTGGPTLSVRNGSSVRLYVTANAYVVG